MTSNRWKAGLAVLSLAALAACGGGGGSPTEQAQAAQTATESQAAVFDAATTPKAARRGANLYIVQMADEPVTQYAGGVKGYNATKPKQGQKIDPNAPAVVGYMSYLAGRHDAAMASVGASKKLYSYGYVYNGFAAEMSEEQAAKMASVPGVLAVSRNEMLKVDTVSTPNYLGLTGATGVWAAQKTKGENIIIGIVDGGVWPEHPSFSDRTDVNGNGTKDGKLGYQQIPGWHGKCTPGENFAASHCNQKLIGAQYFNAGWGGNAGIDEQLPWEFNSPRDYGGHGTHTATTSGGNEGVAVSGDLGVFGSMSGIAPRARIASYKVCWQTAAGGSCFTTDSVAAIDQAVADGVDVINFSISGSQTNFRDPVEIAFMNAASAGVFVAASAGNSGPTTATVAHPGPWLTTVAAATHNRQGFGTLTLGNGAVYSGASIAARSVTAPMIMASAAGLPGASADAVRLCYSTANNGGAPALDPTKVSGKIVVCDRGVTGRTEKSQAVKDAGGLGMVLINVTPNSINADNHALPSIHLADTDYAPVAAYVGTPGATGTIGQGVPDFNAAAPFTASFSSRGPLRASSSLIKPDLIAPGQDIIAGVAPPGNGGRLFDTYSGTSMSSPHVAGLAALLKEARPTWSPMMIKSALMTTGGDVLDGPNTNPLVIFRQGAGHVRPALMTDPGLVFDSGVVDWIGFLCGTQLEASYCTSRGIPVLHPSNFNGASIAVGALTGVGTVTRTVTNVGNAAATYTPTVAGLAGVTVSVSPASITVPKGGKATFALTFTRTTATLNAYTGGQLTLSDGTHSVRVPVVVRPVALSVPAGDVSASYPVSFGYAGPFSATARGLVPAALTAGTVADDPTDGACTLDSPNAVKVPVEVAAGTTFARFSLFDADVTPGADLDMCVFNAAGTQVGGSGSGTSAEQVDLLNPIAGTYTVVVQGWGVVGSSPFKLHSWLLGSADAGNMVVSAPASATIGGTGTVSLSFNGLTPGLKYLGSVAYAGSTGMPNPTIVRVNP